MREIRRYDGNINSKFLEDNRPSRQGSREQLKTRVSRVQAELGDRDEVVTRHP